MTNEERIAQLEKELKELKDALSTIIQGSTPPRLYLKNQVQFDKGSVVGFFGKEPVKQQSAPTPTVAEIKTALQNLGLLS